MFGVLSLRISTLLSELAYSIYLFHGIALYIAFKFIIGYNNASKYTPTQHWLTIFYCVIPLITISYFAHIYIEAPCMKASSAISQKFRKNFISISQKISLKEQNN